MKRFLHRPASAPSGALVLSHGAGSNCESPLLLAVAKAFGQAGCAVLRFDLPFREARPHGPPLGSAARDREGIRQAAEELRKEAPGCPLFLAGHSYGGRQSTMLAAEDPSVADALLLLSYPLHPTGQPAKLRTQHFPSLRTPALFVHGTRDSFGTIAEMEAALTLIPARHRLIQVDGAGHGIPPDVAKALPQWFLEFLNA
jgi:predicted alpha/beta-hydrolase family hydrolase